MAGGLFHEFRQDWPTGVFAAIAILGCGLAFVGLAASSFWTDELFTLFLIDHHGGAGEVLRRALTDTHPPAYYLLLYGWSQAFGVSETALRLLSALLAVSAMAVFFVGARRAFSLRARAFACAMAATSTFWFDQAQNVRNYALAMLVSALLLALAGALHRRLERMNTFPLWLWSALSLTGLIGSFTHFYVFLEVGMIYLFLILTLPSTSLRAALVGSGLVIAILELLYIRLLLHATQQDIQHMWFHNDPLFLVNQLAVAYRKTAGLVGAAALVLLAGLGVARRRGAGATLPNPERGWTAGLCAFAHFGMVAVGLGVSLLLAPSFSNLNLAAASPLLWVLIAWLYDIGAPKPGERAYWPVSLLLVAAIVVHLPEFAGRWLPRNEDWRASARSVAGLPACAGQSIPVVLPQYFGGATPFFRSLAERQMFGRYFPEPARLHAYLSDELAGRRPVPGLSAFLAGRARTPGACPVLAWGVHDLDLQSARALAEGLQRLPGVFPTRVVLKTFDHYEHREVGYKPRTAAFIFVADRSRSAPP